MIVSISGLDNLGKSTQIMLLPFFCEGTVHFAPPLKDFVPQLALPSRQSFQWWMTSDVREFITTIAQGVRHRNANARGSLTVVDRGTDMFKAVCSAKWMMQAGHPPIDEIFAEVNRTFAQEDVVATRNETHIFLTRDNAYMDRTAPLRKIMSSLRSEAGAFTDEENARYAVYQAALVQAVQYVRDTTQPEEVAVSGSILSVQNRVRAILTRRTDCSFEQLGMNIRRIVGLSGLSESGKSTRAEALARENDGYRLKLKFFNLFEVGNGFSSEEALALKLLMFCHAHYFRRYFTIESIHGIRLAAYLKLFFGDAFELQFLDTSFAERVQRWSHDRSVSRQDAEQSVAGRDAQKELLGCSSIMHIADVVV